MICGAHDAKLGITNITEAAGNQTSSDEHATMVKWDSSDFHLGTSKAFTQSSYWDLPQCPDCKARFSQEKCPRCFPEETTSA
eukprot:g68041.t1